MSEYQHVTYGKGFTLRVTPEDRAADVIHFLITGALLGGKSLDGVTWEEVENEVAEKRSIQLAKDMRASQ